MAAFVNVLMGVPSKYHVTAVRCQSTPYVW
jgi:hypothetical protein